MSWARLGSDSDVYVYDDVQYGPTCLWCPLAAGERQSFPSLVALHVHLTEHLRAGHKVPQSALDSLIEDINEATISFTSFFDIRTEEDGTFSISIKFMPGHVGAGATMQEALDNAYDAALAWTRAYSERVARESARES